MVYGNEEMSQRFLEEFKRLGYSQNGLAQRLYTRQTVVSHWVRGNTMPGAFNLAELYRLGFDVIYILTGERTRNDQAGSKNNR